MNENNVLVFVSENELIRALYDDYLIRYRKINKSVDDARMSVKAFSDYVQQYLVDFYNLDSKAESERG